MSDIQDFLPGLLPYAPGVNDPAAFFGLRQAARDFCTRTKLWRHEVELDVEDSDPITITVPDESALVDIELARFEGEPLTARTLKWLDDNCRGWRDGELEGTPNYFTQIDVGTVIVVPWLEGTLKLNVWLKPTEDAEELPDFLLEHHRTTLCHGALAHILAMPNQSFTSVDTAALFASSFEARLNKLAEKSSTGQQRAVVRTRASFM